MVVAATSSQRALQPDLWEPAAAPIRRSYWDESSRSLRRDYRASPCESDPLHFADYRVVAFGARGISAHWSQVTPKLAERCQTDGLRLYAWCKSKSIDPSRLALLDGLVTNWPDLGAAAVRELA